MKNKYNLTLLAIAIIFSLSSCKEDIQYISLDRNEKSLFVGEEYQFQLISTENIEASSIKWSVDNSEYLTIDETGKIKALKTTERTKTTEDGKSITESFSITVKAQLPNGNYALGKVIVLHRKASDKDIVFDKEEIFTYIGGTDSIIVSLSPDFLQKFPDLKLEVSDLEVLSANLLLPEEKDGEVKIMLLGKKDGVASVFLTAGDKKTECLVNVNMEIFLSFEPVETALGKGNVTPEKPYGLQINSSETITIYFRTFPDDEEHLANLNFKVSTEGEPVLLIKDYRRVDAEKFTIDIETGITEGSQKIIVESLGKKVTASIFVNDKNKLEIKSIKFKKQYIETETNISLFSELSVKPIQVLAFFPPLWSSSNEDIATVDQEGQVVFKNLGEVDITVKVKDKEVSCRIKPILSVNNLRISDIKTSFSVGETLTLKSMVNANFNLNKYDVVWEVQDETIAEISAAGELKTKSAGTTTITASITDGKGVKTISEAKEIKVVASNINDLILNQGEFQWIKSNIGGGVKLELYNTNDDTDNYTFNLFFDTGIQWSTNKTYGVGTDITLNSTITYGKSGETAKLKSGSIETQNKKIIFNLTAEKGSTSVSITGEATEYE